MKVKESTISDIALYVANGGSIILLTDDQRKAIPQEIINQRAANGGDLDGLTEDQIKAIPQTFINQCAANGGHLYGLTEDQIKAIPQTFINQRVSNCGYTDGLTEDQIKEIPQEILKPSKKGKEALILYAAHKITFQDLPLDVFVNDILRESLLNIIKTSTKRQFNEICEKHGYKDKIPNKLITSFDEKIVSIHNEVLERQLAGLGESQECQTLKNAVEETKNLTW